jgi:outer membrane protein OmpA-like peptidoglycan-associated protein
MEAFTFHRLAKLVQPVALIAAAFAFFSAPAVGQPAKPEPGKDHPLVGRYEGSIMTAYRAPKYDQAAFIQSPTSNKNDLLQLEGDVSFYYYELPAGRSTFEVERNYERSLKAKGFDIVFSCGSSVGSCYVNKSETSPIRFAEVITNDPVTRWPPNASNKPHSAAHNYGNKIYNTYPNGSCDQGDLRYLLAKREADSGTTHVSIAVCEGNYPDGSYSGAYIAVVDGKAMDTDKIKFIKASEMQKSLQDTGRVNLYGIHFDFDKDEIKPDSQPTIDEMIKLMRANPQIKLQVVGHTDSQGLEPHNNDLSNRRAGSVTRALVQAGIEAGRLSSKGAGSSQPVATNDTEDGRAKNRRVELVGM